jgi:hypothetical protein
MAGLPLVLAGPIVRRVEPRLVAVWVAVRDPVPVTLHVWSGQQVAAPTAGSVTSGNAAVATGGPVNPRRFGQRLHVAVATAELTAPTPPLTPGQLYSYDLTFGGAAGGSGLRGLGLLRDEPAATRLADVDAAAPRHVALGYVENRLPSFVAPPATIDLVRLAHASCRKPNGPGYDALAWLDDHIRDRFSDAARPQQLFLTGDQIYADDVAACLLPMLNGLAADLLGGTERLQVGPNAGDTVDSTLTNLPALFRQRLMRELGGYSSTDAASHLMSFGEFAAMYLAAWSPRVWRALANSTDVLKSPTGAAATVAPHLTQWDACAAEQGTTFAQLRQKPFDDEKANAEVFRDAVPKVARALANVATYMIFDDHEVTDDWNLNTRWRNRAYSQPLGRNVTRNGVMAYGVFQGWGNDPTRFAAPDESASNPNHNRHLLEETEKAFAGNGPFPAAGAQPARLDELCGIPGTTNKQPVFHYRVPGPRHLVAVLDTRTRRSFKGQGLLPANLLGASLNDQVPASLTDGRELLLVVSPAPVLGPHLIDAIAQPLLQSIQDMKVGLSQVATARGTVEAPLGPCEPEGRPVGAEQYDAESWFADEVAFENLLKRLAPIGKAVILSGDVHYACSLVLDYWRKGSPDPPPSRIVQLTSSPARNSFRAVVEAVLRSSALLQRYQAGPRPERLAWTDESSIAVPAGAVIGPGRRARLKRKPSLVPARLWPTGTTIPSDKLPDWRWRLSLQRDLRPDAARPTALRQPTLSAELDAADPVPGYRRVAARHAQTAFTHFDHLRQMVFINNLGLVSFAAAGGGVVRVVHTLLSKDAPQSTTSAENTVHEVSLAATSEPRPELVTS